MKQNSLPENRLRKSLSCLLLCLIAALSATPFTSHAAPSAQRPTPRTAARRNSITKNSVGAVKLGMTIAEARRALPAMLLQRGSDGEGIAYVDVLEKETLLMRLYAGEGDSESAINEQAKIELIEAVDDRFATVEGVHTGTPLRQVERVYGKLREIVLSEIEQREFATFARQPSSLTFKVSAGDNVAYAGIYRKPSAPARTRRYTASAHITGIIIRT